MRIAIAASIATDHLMTFPGRFTDSLVSDKLDKVSLSFLVDDLEIRRGGVAANIAYGLAALGLRPLLVGAAGADFAEYRSALEQAGVDCDAVLISASAHTARFVCTTDADHNQIASFYVGAMAEARDARLAPLAEHPEGLDLALIGADDVEAMLRHTDECRDRGIPFAADPSQQLARLDGEQIRRLVDGATYLFTNEYEAALLQQKTGWSAEDVLSRVGTRITTHGSGDIVIERAGELAVRIPVVQPRRMPDPTGVGDAFRAGYLTGISWSLSPERCAQVGALLATYVLESVGTQEYTVDAPSFLQRLGEAYGADAAAEVAPHLSAVPTYAG